MLQFFAAMRRCNRQDREQKGTLHASLPVVIPEEFFALEVQPLPAI